ncbi:sensor histidine kinase [Sphaerisporangium corydalis]|uniref:histidine kinase n=1 Tax=Sphaerisporangium corydalis TaxID=1441875 RepID=A0ABV9EKU5_9ACTN|nr:HAMP domain-containing sensor histidine kinase [Sphaerisporangium corydalis]
MVARWPVRSRLTLYAGVVAAVLSALLATVLMVAVQRLATEYLTEEVNATAGRIAGEIDRGVVRTPIRHGLIGFLQVVDPAGTVVASSAEMRGRPAMARFTFTGGKNDVTSVVCGPAFPGNGCNIVAGRLVYRMDRPWNVYAAAPVVPILVHPILASLVIGGAALLTVVLTYGAYRVVTASLCPVEAIRSELDEINATCPGRRVPVPNSEDEIHDLAESVNHTLGRLQGAMEQQRRLASDASHDLRSPITAMRAEVEDALMDPYDHDWPATGRAVLGGLDRLQAIVADLLTIARLDAGAPCAYDTVDLGELVTAEMQIRRPVKALECDLEHGTLVQGDRLRLARLVTNLVDNAERHADDTIKIKVYRDVSARTALLEVLDDGGGIAPDKRELVFQRFTRLEAARHRDEGGTGLGLPIARQIAEMSGGTLTIGESARGARFVLRLPLAPGPVPPDRLG